jgi:hypothetical protein
MLPMSTSAPAGAITQKGGFRPASGDVLNAANRTGKGGVHPWQ